MINELILLAVISASPAKVICPGTKMIGWAKPSDMSENDKNMFEIAKAECPKRYPKSPCLKAFELKGFQNYKVTCGAPK